MSIDISNDQLVGTMGDGSVVVMLPKRRMTKAEALRHAAWLVTLADATGNEFPAVLAAVQKGE